MDVLEIAVAFQSLLQRIRSERIPAVRAVALLKSQLGPLVSFREGATDLAARDEALPVVALLYPARAAWLTQSYEESKREKVHERGRPVAVPVLLERFLVGLLDGVSVHHPDPGMEEFAVELADVLAADWPRPAHPFVDAPDFYALIDGRGRAGADRKDGEKE